MATVEKPHWWTTRPWFAISPPTTHSWVAFFVLVLFAAQTALPYTRTIPSGQDAQTLIIGSAKVIENALMLILGYYFGSTKGSESKTETIKNLSEQKNPPPPGQGQQQETIE